MTPLHCVISNFEKKYCSIVNKNFSAKVFVVVFSRKGELCKIKYVFKVWRERDRERETERETETETERQRQRETETERQRQRQRQISSEKSPVGKKDCILPTPDGSS